MICFKKMGLYATELNTMQRGSKAVNHLPKFVHYCLKQVGNSFSPIYSERLGLSIAREEKAQSYL